MYRNAFDNSGVVVNLNDVLFADKYKDKVYALRRTKDREAYNQAKKQMPMFTISGVFDVRSKNGLREHSGLICLDIDGKENPDLNIGEFIETMRWIDVVYYAGYSIGGSGCFIVIPISEPKQHEHHFNALKKDFERLGANIDVSCRDVSRSRFVSYNPKPYYNPNAKIYNKMTLPTKINHSPCYVDTHTDIERLVNKVVLSGINITCNYNDWFALACSLRGVDGGRAMFHRLSAMDARYNSAETEYQFDAVDANGGYDERKFFEICKRYGIYLYDKRTPKRTA